MEVEDTRTDELVGSGLRIDSFHLELHQIERMGAALHNFHREVLDLVPVHDVRARLARHRRLLDEVADLKGDRLS